MLFDADGLFICLFFDCAGPLLLRASRCRECDCALWAWCRGFAVAASLAVERGPQGIGVSAVAHLLSCSPACGIFLDPGLTVSPAAAGAFSTTEPSGKPLVGLFLLTFY